MGQSPFSFWRSKIPKMVRFAFWSEGPIKTLIPKGVVGSLHSQALGVGKLKDKEITPQLAF